MNQSEDVKGQLQRVAASTNTQINRNLLILTVATFLGGFAVWQLRQEGARDWMWPWALLIIAIFTAGTSLNRSKLWLPGQAILPRLEAFPAQRTRVVGMFFIVAALAITGLLMWRLWPDYHQWQGTQLLWMAALTLFIFGAWALGAVGRGSPRAATALTLWPNTRYNRLWEGIAFVFIIALAIFLRTYRLESIPPGIYVDETNGALDALYLLEGRDASPFATGWYGTPNGYIYYMAAVFKLFGANWFSLKIVSLIPAILTVPAVYFLGRLMFGPLAGLGAMFLMAVSRWHLSMSRWGWNETAPPLFQVLALFFLIRGLRDRRALDYAISGLLTGLSIYTYLSARLAAATLILYILYWIFSDPSGWLAALRRSWLGLLILGAAALVAVAPIAVTYLTDPFILNNRVSEISVFRDIREQGTLAPLTQNIADILKFFHQTGDHQGKHNLPDEPMVDPITGLLFAFGLAYGIIAWRDQRRMLLILWLVVGLAGSFLSSQHESPQAYRSLTALPAVVLMAADVLDRLTRAIYRCLSEQSIFTTKTYLPSLIAGGIATVALMGAGLWETNVYFGRQAASVDTLRGFNPTENSVARDTIAALKAGEQVYLSPNFSSYSPLRFLVYGVVKKETGSNTLDDQPYKVILPEVSLPIPDIGKDVLMMLDINYWSLRSYIESLYPGASMDLVKLSDGSPIYMRVRVPQEQVAELQGLIKEVTYPNGQTEKLIVKQVELSPDEAQATEVIWSGFIRLEHGGEYEMLNKEGLQVYIADQPWNGKRYLGRGLYKLLIFWRGGDIANAQLSWRIPDRDAEMVPAQALFHMSASEQGLLGTYWRNSNWEGEPLFQQVTPFLLLAWPDEQPIVPNGEFSARYVGILHITRAGSYLLRVEADDGARLILDGNVLGEGLIPGQPNYFEVPVELEAGDHPIQIDYFQQGGGSALRLFWRYGDEELTPVPPGALIPIQP